MRVAVVIETENLAAADPVGLLVALASIRAQRESAQSTSESGEVTIQGLLIDTGRTPPELLRRIVEEDPQLDVRVLAGVEGYYQVKAATVDLVDADIIVFADADCRYEQGWLSLLLDALRDPGVAISTGETATAVRNARELAFATTFMLEPRSGKTGITDTYSYYFNNVAIRRSVLVEQPLLDHLAPSIRGTCSLHGRAVARSGKRIVRVHNAGAVHALPAGLTQCFWRYLLLGADSLVLGRQLYLRGFNEYQSVWAIAWSQLRMGAGRLRTLRRTGLAPSVRLVAAIPLMSLLILLRLVGTAVETVRPGLLLRLALPVLGT
jgi:hypothetical protein